MHPCCDSFPPIFIFSTRHINSELPNTAVMYNCFLHQCVNIVTRKCLYSQTLCQSSEWNKEQVAGWHVTCDLWPVTDTAGAPTWLSQRVWSPYRQTGTGWCYWRPQGGRRPSDDWRDWRRETKVWRRLQVDGVACWPTPSTDSSSRGTLL